jgi:broad specificity phosphatase PhoE
VTRLVVCRHADPDDPKAAEALAYVLQFLPLAAVHTSPLPRAQTTAAAVVRPHALTPIVAEALREIDLGEVEGKAFDEYPPELKETLLRDSTLARFPGGETFAELQRRVCEAVDEIVARHDGATVAVITHAGPIRALLAAWLDIAGDAIFRLDQRYGSVNVVDWIDGVPLVRLVNGSRP